MKSKRQYLSLILCFIIFSVSIHASDVNNDSHQQITAKYIDQLEQIQKEIFSLSGEADSNQFKSTYDVGFGLISDSLNNLNESMYTYYNSLPDKSIERRDILLLISAANLLQSALLELGLISNSASYLDITLILKNYFNFVNLAEQSINDVKALISNP